ncbi:Bifunctional ligase/repressor BirA [bacterium HR23]|nr:Bifunctional ligase/repressor BirA [bacterium HR23]
MGNALAVEAVAQDLGTRRVGRCIFLFPSLSSTMDAAHRLAQLGVPEGAVVLAEEQTAGRGRFQRQWHSPPGVNLYLSIVLRPPAEAVRRVNMACSLAVVDTVRQIGGLSPSVKWPNDVRLRGRKVCGILIEGRWEGQSAGWLVVGIGLNVNADFASTPLEDVATSLALETGRLQDRTGVLRSLLRFLDQRYEQALTGYPLWREWQSHLEGLGQPLAVRWGQQVVEGVAEGVTPEGDLIVCQVDGTRAILPTGEVTTHTGVGSAPRTPGARR